MRVVCVSYRTLNAFSCMFVFRAVLLIVVAAIALRGVSASAQETPAAMQGGSEQALPGALQKSVPSSSAPRIDGGEKKPGILPENVSALSVAAPPSGEFPPSQPQLAPQNRVHPANADTLRNNPERTETAFVYSPNWLLDGVRQLEAAQKRELAPANPLRADGEHVTEQGPHGDPVLPDAQDQRQNSENGAFALHLKKWLTATPPLAVIGDSQNVQHAGSAAAVDSQHAFATASLFQVNAQAPANLPLPDLTRTELDATGPTITLPPPALPAPAEMRAPNVAANADTQLNAAANPIAADKKLTIKNNQVDADAAKPIVNDKKYFPQFQRF